MLLNKTQDSSLRKLTDRLFATNVERHVLDNGMVLICLEDRSAPVVAVRIFVRTGSIHEERYPGSGVSHFLEHMLFKGTPKRSEQQLMEEVQQLGGYSNAYTSHDHTAYQIDLPARYAGEAIDILSDMVFSSTLDPAEAIREKEVIMREIAMYEDDPYSRMGQVLLETAFREHPARFPVIGYRDVFGGLSAEELQDYYRSRYAPNNTVMVVVGDIDAGTIRKKVEEGPGQLPRARLFPSLVNPEPVQFGRRVGTLFGDVQLSRQGMAFRIPGMDHPDAAGLRVLAGLLGQGKSSTLWKNLRNREGLVYEIDAGVWAPTGLGLWQVYFLVDPDKRKKARDAVFSELRNWAREPVAPEKLTKFFRQYCAREIARKKSMRAQAEALGSAEVVAGDLEYPRMVLREMEKVTPNRLMELAETYLVEEHCTEVSLDPRPKGSRRSRKISPVRSEEAFSCEELDNGVKVIWQEDHRLPTGIVQAIMAGGLCYEGRVRAGASTLLANLLTKDTSRHTADEVEEWTEDQAVQFRASSGQTFLSLAIESRPDDVNEASLYWGDALLEPALREETFQRERLAALADYQEEMDDPREWAWSRFRRHFWDEHPLAALPGGDDESLGGLGVSDVRQLYQKLLVGSNLVVTMGGDLSAKKDRDRIYRRLGDIPAGAPPVPLTDPLPVPEREGRIIVEKRPAEQEIVFLGFPFPGVRDPRARLEVPLFNEIFNGMSSRLFHEVRNRRGLAYYVGASESYALQEGFYIFQAGTAPGKGPEVLEEMWREIRRIAGGGLQKEEWERCRNTCLSRQSMQRQSLNYRLSAAGFSALYGYDPNEAFSFADRLMSVPSEAMAELASSFLQPEKALGYILEPQS